MIEDTEKNFLGNVWDYLKNTSYTMKILPISLMGAGILTYGFGDNVYNYIKDSNPRQVRTVQRKVHHDPRKTQGNHEEIKVKLLEPSVSLVDYEDIEVTPDIKVKKSKNKNYFIPRQNINYNGVRLKVYENEELVRDEYINENKVININKPEETKSKPVEIKRKEDYPVNISEVEPVPMPEPSLVKIPDVNFGNTENDEYNLEAMLIPNGVPRNPSEMNQKLIPEALAIEFSEDYGSTVLNGLEKGKHIRIFLDDPNLDELLDYRVQYSINGEVLLGHLNVGMHKVNGKLNGITLTPVRDNLYDGMIRVEFKVKNQDNKIEDEVLEVILRK